MLSALLIPLFIGAPATPAAALADDPPIRLWINNDGRFLPGDRAKVEVRTREDGYLLVFHVDPDGHLRVLFPLDPDRDNFVRGGKKYEIRGRGDRESFEIDTKTGKGTVYAAVSRDPMRFDGFVVADHWDYRALAPSRLPDDPEQDLNELARRMGQSDFDYDLVNYFVGDRVAYRSDYSPGYYGSAYSDPWCYSFSCGSYYGSPFNVSIGLSFGRPYRRYYYDPYYYAYDPFYNPFFYDPYYYATAYRPRYVYPYSRYYDYPYYRDRYYYDRYRTYSRPYTPYRFRGADGFTAGFRDRRGPTRFVNTVYNPPISPVREGPVASPGRRLTSPAADGPGSAGPARDTDGPRLVRRTIEARRAGGGVRVEAGRKNEGTPVRRETDGSRNTPRSEPREERAPPARREVERAPARETRPASPPERAPAREARPERREVDRPSAPPPQDRGGSRSGDEGGRRRR
ncbi:MAG: DUF4384 domain-containing protein [Gemmatimonadales bacterium]